MFKKKLTRLTIFIIPLIFIFSQCFNFKKAEDPRGNAYAGSATCVSCHKNMYNSYLHTAHYMASMPSDPHTIQGSFAKGANEFILTPHIKVVMDKRDSGFFQTEYDDGIKQQSQRFDIVFGGIKGQTYGYWMANELFQLPVSYVSNMHKWINSPGYDTSRIAFERIIGVRCLDCHASYAKSAPPDLPGFYTRAEGFEKTSLVYSIDCERCHGPAAEHVKFQTENPGEKTAKYIIPFKSLTREQKINMCAVCHSGAGTKMYKPSFDYKPTDTLAKYMNTGTSGPIDYTHIDVHGNQKDLLKSSKCFIASTMDCSTCHDTHVNDRDNALLYASKCMTCHNTDSHIQCKMVDKLSAALLTSKCISCHMPALTSKAIIAGQAPTQVHTHHIGIYPLETKKVLSLIK